MFLSNLIPILSQWYNREAWLDQLAKPVQNFTLQLFKSGGATGLKIANLLNGT